MPTRAWKQKSHRTKTREKNAYYHAPEQRPELKDLWREEGPLVGYNDPKTFPGSPNNPDVYKGVVTDEEITETVAIDRYR